MEWGSILGLIAVTLLVIALFIFFGLKLSRAVQKHAPESHYAQSITLTGTALFACMVGFWVICAAARELRPNSSFGALLGSADGVAAMFAVSILFIMLAIPVLQKLGFPIIKTDR